ncbi:MAG: 2-keto-4-pentenoate hydratase [Gammaproteobacteria bacterium]|jgi:2-keto-4-pentenoate hydratase
MMSIEQTSEFLFDLRRDNRAVEALPEALCPADLTSAYAAQALLVDRLCAHWHGQTAGYKIALTSPTAQSLLGVPHPVFGRLISSRCYDSGTSLTAGEYCTRIIEVEFAFVMATDVPRSSTPYSAVSIAPYITSLHPAIEIVNHRFAALDRLNACSLAADNAIHGSFVQGPAASAWHDYDLGAHAVRLLVNDEPILSGAGDRTLGHPLNALAWLANALPIHDLDLRAGDFITTGLVTDGIYHALPGDHLIGDFGALGQVAVTFTD